MFQTLEFDNESIQVIKIQKYEFLMSNSEVAKGYGVSESSIREHKSKHSDEFIEGKHYFIITQNNAKEFNISLPPKVRNQTFWTKRGVIRLGFFIKSERAKKFRDWAEDLVIEQLLQTPETAHQTVQTQNETFDLNFYSQEIEKMAKLVEFLNSKNTKILYYLDNLSKSLNIQSPLELLKIDLSNYYFIPTELGNFINASPVEANKILESKGFQIRENGVWHLTEKGRDFGIEVQNGSFLQIKWTIKSII
jgi:prophage antirepressor-like protein